MPTNLTDVLNGEDKPTIEAIAKSAIVQEKAVKSDIESKTPNKWVGAELLGGVIRDIKPSTQPRIAPSLQTKILKEAVVLGKKAWYVISPSYICEVVTGNVADPSLPSSSMNGSWDMWRTGIIRKVSRAAVFKKPEVSGTWTDYKSTGMFDGIDMLSFSYKRTTVAGSIATFTDIKIDETGICKIAFLATTTSNSSQEVKVNGVTAGVFDLSSPTGGLYIKVIDVPCGNGIKTITIENVSGIFYLLGANYCQLSDAKDSLDVDDCYVFTSNYGYTSNRGAHDYAFKSRTNNLWGGSYHGGQTSLAEPFATDGKGKTMLNTDTGMVLAKGLVIHQKTRITWNANESFDIDEIRKFGDVEIFEKVVGVGFLQAHTMHFGMTGTSPYFDTIFGNKYIKDMPDGLEIIGKTNDTIQIAEEVGRMLVAEWSEPEIYECLPYDGNTVSAVTGAYNKVYQAPIRNTNVAVSRFSYSFNRKFM